MKKLWSAIGNFKIQHFLFLLFLSHMALVAMLLFSMVSLKEQIRDATSEIDDINYRLEDIHSAIKSANP